MSKRKQSTVYLSEDIYKYIMEYKERNNLNNLSTAIERLMLERIFREKGKLDTGTNEKSSYKETLVKSKTTKLLNNIINTMPD